MTEKELILGLLRLGTGHGIDLFGILWLHQLEDGRFGVYHDPKCMSQPEDIAETLFENAEQAVDLFIARRHQLHLGYEFEGDSGGEFYREKAGVV